MLKIPIGFVFGVLLCIAGLAVCPWMALEVEKFDQMQGRTAFDKVLQMYWGIGALVSGAGGAIGLLMLAAYWCIEKPWEDD